MKKMLLTTYWTASEVHTVLEFLVGLQTIIKVSYADELNEFYWEIINEEQRERFSSENDAIPF